MIEHTFDVITRRAVGETSRRATILALGTAGAAALAHPFTVEAKKNGGKKKGKKKRCANQEDRCALQLAQCTTVLGALCGGRPDCQDSVACCSFLGSCDAQTFLTCLANGG
jgi:hypothetical protein